MRPSRRVIFLVLGLILLLSCASFAQGTFYFPQIGDGVFGDLRFQTTLVLVNTGGDVTAKVEFFATPSGEPLELALGDLGTSDTFMVELKAGGSVSLTTAGLGGIVVGYARVTDPRVGSAGTAQSELGGTAVFTRSDVTTGIKLYEAGVPASTSLDTFTVFVDTIGDLDTGLALVNPDEATQTVGVVIPEVQLSLRDTEFQEIASTVVPLAPGAHNARFIGQIFDAVAEANEMQGTVVVNSPEANIVAVTLRQNDIPGVDFPQEVPTLTAFPVVPGAAAGALGIASEGRLEAASFTALDSNRLAVTFRLPQLDWVREVRLHFLNGDIEVGSAERQVAAGWTLSDVFELHGSSSSIDRIEVELIGDAGNRALFFVIR